MNYNWENKNDRAKIAKKHTKEMEEKYRDQIERSIEQTKIYEGSLSSSSPDLGRSCVYTMYGKDCVSAILEHASGKTAVLNFASYKHPGGMFLEGSRAQEECLCHESFLYNVLSAFEKDYYAWNCEHKNRGLYTNRALYSPKICFERDDQKVYCDVITCAAPNYTTAAKYCFVSREENSKILRSRIKFVLDIAESEGVETLILGAFGAGVFGQDAEEVAKIFKEELTKNTYNFKHIYFSIIEDLGENYNKFKRGWYLE